MSELDQVLDISQRLGVLRDRLVELDKERALVQGEIDACLSQLAVSTGQRFLPLGSDATMRDQILAMLRRHPERRLSASDVDEAFGGRLTAGELANVRTLLARMAKQGALVRVRQGLYRLGK